MNSPFLDAARWDAEVAKMIKSFGAPIDPADAKTIGDYLKENYGGEARRVPARDLRLQRALEGFWPMFRSLKPRYFFSGTTAERPIW